MTKLYDAGWKRIRPFTYAFSFDADRLDGEQWIVTKEFRSGWTVVAKFATKAEAQNYIASRGRK